MMASIFIKKIRAVNLFIGFRYRESQMVLKNKCMFYEFQRSLWENSFSRDTMAVYIYIFLFPEKNKEK